MKEYYPVDIHGNEASYDIQFGNVTRPTQSNTSWDFAKGGYKQSQTVQQAYLINNPLKGVYVDQGSGVLKRIFLCYM